ncbi:MAG: biotin--[acetyl-CoA-carboxylase] ligase [Peptococcia bacterium]
MKKEILGVLMKNPGKYISGAELSESLKVSRTAVWKQIKVLKELGYEIESKPNSGYRLISSPDILQQDELTLKLRTEWLGHNMQIFEELSSTNDFAKTIANEGAVEGPVIVAEEQTKGRGRMGRLWESPASKGLWFSIILRPLMPPQLAPQLIFVAAVGICRALRGQTGLDIRIKWPNDLLYEGQKLCGILAEMSAEIEQLNYIILGIGLNVNQENEDFSPEIVETATSLSLAARKKYRRADVLAEILFHLEEVYTEYQEQGFQKILKAWESLNCTAGRQVKVMTREETFEGFAESIDEDGSLLVRRKDGQLETVIVGDISLR